MTMNSNEKMLNKQDLNRVFWGNHSNEAVWDNVRGNNLGFTVALVPALKKIYANQPDKYKEALHRHANEFFNTAMQPIPFIQGIVLAMEEENSKTNDYNVSTITAIKAALIGPTAGVFDALFLNTLRVIGVALGVNFCMEGNPVGALIYLLIYNAPGFYCKWKGVHLGYNLGTDTINKLLSSGLMDKFKLSEVQAQAILDMRLQKLTGLEREKVEAEYNELMKKIAYLESILADEHLLLGVIKDEILEIKRKYADERRTEIRHSEGEIDMRDLIDDEEITITLTHFWYIKRLPLDTYKSQRRGGRGISALTIREEDFVKHLITTRTHNKLLFFTNRGRVFKLDAYEVPEGKR